MDIEQEVKSAMPAIMNRIREEAISRMEREALNVVVQEANAAARQWAIEVLVPEVRAQLEAGKHGLISAAETVSKQLAEEVSKAMVAQAVKNLANSWTLKNVVSEMFK